MTIDDALSLVKNEGLSLDLNEYRVACRVLADEVRRLRERTEQENKETMQGMTGCSDINCLFQENSGSVATNGGCSCEKELRYSSPNFGVKAARMIRYLRQQLADKSKDWSEGFELGRKDAMDNYHQTLEMFNHGKEDALDILKTYLRLHGGKIGAHWLWSAIERIVMGENEVDVLEDYGYFREGAKTK